MMVHRGMLSHFTRNLCRPRAKPSAPANFLSLPASIRHLLARIEDRNSCNTRGAHLARVAVHAVAGVQARQRRVQPHVLAAHDLGQQVVVRIVVQRRHLQQQVVCHGCC